MTGQGITYSNGADTGDLVYGLRDGRLHHISNVVSGKACGCICPDCKSPLIARKGQIRAWHFAHESGSSCAGARESALHMLAKQLFGDASLEPAALHALSLPVPARSVTLFEETRVVRPAGAIKIASADIEIWQDGVRPDVIAYDGDHTPYYVEIYVTHAVDWNKLEKLKAGSIPVVEIDLSNVDRDIAEADLLRILRCDTWRYRWLYDPGCDAAAAAASEDLRAERAARIEAERKRLAYKAELERLEQDRIKKAREEAMRKKAEEEEAARKLREAEAARQCEIDEARQRKAAERAELEERLRVEKVTAPAGINLHFAPDAAPGGVPAFMEDDPDKIKRRIKFVPPPKGLMHKMLLYRCMRCGSDLDVFQDSNTGDWRAMCSSAGCRLTWRLNDDGTGFVLADRQSCPRCGSELARRSGRYGPFMACGSCGYTRSARV